MTTIEPLVRVTGTDSSIHKPPHAIPHHDLMIWMGASKATSAICKFRTGREQVVIRVR